MNWFAKIALLRRVNEWIKARPWAEKLIGFLAGLFKSDPNAPKVHGAHDPDKPVTIEDIQRGDPA